MRPASRLRASAVVAMRGCRGFTLVELMVVLVIVGLMGAAVVLTAPDDSRTLVREADTFAARLVHAGEEAIQIGRAHYELQSLMRTSYAVFCLKNKIQ